MQVSSQRRVRVLHCGEWADCVRLSRHPLQVSVREQSTLGGHPIRVVQELIMLPLSPSDDVPLVADVVELLSQYLSDRSFCVAAEVVLPADAGARLSLSSPSRTDDQRRPPTIQ